MSSPVFIGGASLHNWSYLQSWRISCVRCLMICSTPRMNSRWKYRLKIDHAMLLLQWTRWAKAFTYFPAALWPNIYGLNFHSSSNRVQWRVDVYLLGQLWDGRSQPIYENKNTWTTEPWPNSPKSLCIFDGWPSKSAGSPNLRACYSVLCSWFKHIWLIRFR